jgi:hypothetical protein
MVRWVYNNVIRRQWNMKILYCSRKPYLVTSFLINYKIIGTQFKHWQRFDYNISMPHNSYKWHQGKHPYLYGDIYFIYFGIKIKWKTLKIPISYQTKQEHHLNAPWKSFYNNPFVTKHKKENGEIGRGKHVWLLDDTMQLIIKIINVKHYIYMQMLCNCICTTI